MIGKSQNYENLHVVDALMSQLSISTAPITANKALSDTKPDMMPGAIAAAAADSVNKMDHIRDARVALATQLKESDNGADHTRRQVFEAGQALGLGFVMGSNALSPGYKADTVDLMQHAGLGHAGLQHAGMQHAAISNGPSLFKSSSSHSKSSSKEEKKSEIYRDFSGESWTLDGMRAPVQPQFSNPQNAQFNAELLDGAGKIVKSHGKEKAIKDLNMVTRSEERLMQQSQAAQNLAWEKYGVETPPELAVKKPVLGIQGPKPFGGFFG